MAVRLPGGSCFSIAPEEIHIDAAGFGTEEAHEQAVKREVTRRLYRYLSEETGRTLAWGTLTGVRPTKIPMEQLEQGASEEAAGSFMMENYYVSPEKARLAAEVAARENALLSRLDCERDSACMRGSPSAPVCVPTVRSVPRPLGSGRNGWTPILTR